MHACHRRLFQVKGLYGGEEGVVVTNILVSQSSLNSLGEFGSRAATAIITQRLPLCKAVHEVVGSYSQNLKMGSCSLCTRECGFPK